jgi:hypothetical protein
MCFWVMERKRERFGFSEAIGLFFRKRDREKKGIWERKDVTLHIEYIVLKLLQSGSSVSLR